MAEKKVSWYQKYFSKYVNRETITYLVAGVLTTLVNYTIYILFTKVIVLDKYVANTIAWVVAVSFAYIINDVWVFRQERQGLLIALNKIFKFFAARVFSLFVEVLGLFLFSTLLHINDLIVKAMLAIVVIIVNYFFSKLFIFKGKKP